MKLIGNLSGEAVEGSFGQTESGAGVVRGKHHVLLTEKGFLLIDLEATGSPVLAVTFDAFMELAGKIDPSFVSRESGPWAMLDKREIAELFIRLSGGN
jgi:hypothetical protein